MMFFNGICYIEINIIFVLCNIIIKIISGWVRKLLKLIFMKRYVGYYSVFFGMLVIFVIDCWCSMEVFKIFFFCSVFRKVENKLMSCVNFFSFIICCLYYFFMLF